MEDRPDEERRNKKLLEAYLDRRARVSEGAYVAPPLVDTVGGRIACSLLVVAAWFVLFLLH